MINTIRTEYSKLSELDKKVLRFSGKIIFSELSKIIILLIFFTLIHNTKEFLFATFALFPIRCQIGGLHCKTYWGCLTATLVIFFSAIMIFPQVLALPPLILTGTLILCALISVSIGPILNPTRPKLTSEQERRSKCIVLLFIFCYIMLSFALDFNHYTICGAWIIIIQTMQLIAANIKRRRLTL